MSYTLTIPAATLLVEELPSVSSSMMIYDVDSNPNLFFPKITRDKILQDEIYFKGSEPIDSTSIFYDTKPVEVTNSIQDIVSSVPKERGIYDIIYSDPISGTSSLNDSNSTIIFLAVPTTIVNEVSVPSWNINDRVLVESLKGVIDGYYRIIEVTNSSITINCIYNDSININLTSGIVKKVVYFWNEIYTTPLGVYTSGFSFHSSDDSLEDRTYYLDIDIKDKGILPKEGDFIIMQVIKLSGTIEDTDLTTDDLDSQINNMDCEQFQFKIIAPVVYPSNNSITWRLTIDKPFSYLINTNNSLNCFFSLLNRKNDLTIDTDLFKNTWEFREIYGRQIVGDGTPLVDSSSSITGQKNYLNYSNSEWTGLYPQLKGIIKSIESPIALFHFNDNIKDRIDYTSSTGSIELHLPNIMIQGEQSPVVFTNGKATYRPEGIGYVSPLVLKYPQSSTLVTYGWVCHDLRFIVIDDEEVVTALSYSSNRNYTLPNNYEELLSVGNRRPNHNINSVLEISNITSNVDGSLVITTSSIHGFSDGDQIIIQDVEGTTNANTLAGNTYYIKKIDSTSFSIFYSLNLENLSNSLSVIDTNTYVPGTGTCYIKAPDYKYFLTYRVRGKYCNSLPMAKLMPFNFSSDKVYVDNNRGSVTVKLPALTHLDDSFGFSILNEKYTDQSTDKPQWDLIIGTYLLDSDGMTTTGFDVNSVLTIPGGRLEDEITFNIQSYTQPYSLPEIKTTNFPVDTQPLVLVNINNETIFYKFYTEIPIGIPVDNDNWIQVGNIYWHKTDCGLYINNIYNSKLYNSGDFYTYVNLNNTSLVAKNPWLLGNVSWYEHQQQYRLSFEAKLLAQNWNGTTNPTFKPSTIMNEKLISEIAFLISEIDSKGNVVVNDSPYIYAKINPPINKTNTKDMSIALNLDF